jgi:hypothetical protein
MKLDCAAFLNLDRDLKRQSETLRGATGSDVVAHKGCEETLFRYAKQIPPRQRPDREQASCNHVGPAYSSLLNFLLGKILPGQSLQFQSPGIKKTFHEE